jgi:hypothetical protein
MKRYSGVTPDDIPRHGGEYVREHGFGHEAINFQPHNGNVYGFVQLRTGTINVSRLDPNASDKADDVLVVWRARSSRGSVIVGWYKHATVYSELQEPLQGRSFHHGGKTISPWWIIKARHSDTFVVPPHHRFFTVPVSHKGFGSQTFVSFLDSHHQEVATFKQKLLQYIQDAESGHYPSPRQGKKPQIDHITKLKIERAAIEAAARFYGDQGYDVISVEREHVGYDLEARCKSDTLLVEVKGTNHRTDDTTVNLSPNEYRKSKSRKRQYRVCIVTNALSSPDVHDFLWDTDEEMWRDENTGRRLIVEEVVSADMTIQ